MESPIIIWHFRTKQSRARRVAGHVFRIARNALAVLGVFFAYLLILGYSQYVDQADVQITACASNRCT
ncbi:hypothetical protein [Burkholderia anthina]|uniref:hypothetical protein n=1 Tax=Burkholderia anthina TaxID=179879 RepID=UPI001AA08B52|nr:hypothetical protein [Burkholderia anthina]QTD91778.1 hypothetical protein J4G50_26350 [Burkholderia anthina]